MIETNGQPVVIMQVPSQRLFGMMAAARYLGVSEDSLRAYSGCGMIPAVRLNNRRMFKLEDLDAFIDALPQYRSAGRLNVAENPVERSRDGS